MAKPVRWTIGCDNPFVDCDFIDEGVVWSLFLGDIYETGINNGKDGTYIIKSKSGVAKIRRPRQNTKYYLKAGLAPCNLYDNA